jgi:hypothetical protein
MIADAEYGALVIFTAQDMVDDVRRVLERTARVMAADADLVARMGDGMTAAQEAVNSAIVSEPVFVRLAGLRAIAIATATARDTIRAYPEAAVELGVEPANVIAAAAEFRDTVHALRIVRQSRLS